jgi:hypothetical protein
MLRSSLVVVFAASHRVLRPWWVAYARHTPSTLWYWIKEPSAWLLFLPMHRFRPLARPLRLALNTRAPLGARWGSSASPASVSHLNSVTEQDVLHFGKILPATSILSTIGPKPAAESELASYNNDWMGKYQGKSRVVLRPKTAQQVSEIVKYCNERGIGIVPQGGNTGLVGGSVPINDEVVINLGSMSNIRSFDPVSGKHVRPKPCACTSSHDLAGVLIADGGCVLETLMEHIAKEEHIMPFDLGAKGR